MFSPKDVIALSVPSEEPPEADANASSHQSANNTVHAEITMTGHCSSSKQTETADSVKEISKTTENKSQVNPEPQEKLTSHGKERKETREELEAFLFGDLPYVPKTPPRKKYKTRAETATPDEPTPAQNEGGSSSPAFLRPYLTFDPVKWSPSKQRDLLSIAKDVAELQRSLEAGELPKEPLCKLVPFTKPSD